MILSKSGFTKLSKTAQANYFKDLHKTTVDAYQATLRDKIHNIFKRYKK